MNNKNIKIVSREEINNLNHEYSFTDWLICSILKSAIQNEDWRYFTGDEFKKHMRIMDVHPSKVVDRLPWTLRRKL